jgi:TPR repeat protein
MGSLSAQGNLGVLYINGEGVPRDDKKAAELFRDGALKGNASCMFYYAMCLEGGRGVKTDEEEAKEWYVKAAKAGDRRAVEWCRKNDVSTSGLQRFR